MASLSVTVEHPSAHITVATESEMLSFVGKSAMYSNTFDGDVLSLTTTRDMGQDCPTFSMNIVYRNDWFTKIGSNDLVIIALQRPPEAKHNVLVGLVDDVRKTTDFSTGKPVRAFTLTGRGFNKALQNFTVGTVSELTVTASIQGFFSTMLEVFSGAAPAVIIKGVLDNYIGMGCNYSFANGKTFKDYYQESIKNVSNGNEFLADATAFTSFQGGLWDFLKELKNAPFNEMFWEIINDRPTIIFRPTPFNKDNWNSLQCVTIKDSDIINENLGRSDLETYVVYKVKAETFGGDTDILGYLPYWYPPYYTKYGITRLEVYSKYLEYNGDDLSTIQDKMKDIFNWNIKNNYMENGTITVKGLNCYKVGTRVKIASTGMEYYCEGVTHNFNFGTGWTTTLSLTRGLEPSDRFTAPWGCYKQMTAADVSKIYGYTVTDADIDPITGTFGNTSTSGGSNASDPQWKQYDSKWGSNVMQTKTIKQVGCLMTSVSILLKMTGLTDSNFNPAVMNSYLKSHGGYVNGNNFVWASTDGYVSGWKHVGSATLSGTNSTKMSKIKSLIQSGYYVTVCVKNGGHWVAITGYDDNDITMSDPASNSTGLFGKYGSTVCSCHYFSCSVPFSCAKQTGSTASGNSNESTIYKFLTGTMGLNTAAACGVLANIEAESSFNPTVYGDSGTSYGICQWHNGRFTSLKNWCNNNGYNYQTINGQLNYLQYELKNSYPSVWNKLRTVSNSATGAYEAAYYWCYYYEVPANRESKSVSRGNTAKKKYWPNYS